MWWDREIHTPRDLLQPYVNPTTGQPEEKKVALKVLWKLIYMFHVCGDLARTVGAGKKSSPATALKEWINTKLTGQQCGQVRSLRGDGVFAEWCDGRKLCHLVEAVGASVGKPGIIPALDRGGHLGSGQAIELIQTAMTAAEQHLGIPKAAMAPQMLLDQSRFDRKILLVYLKYFTTARAQAKKIIKRKSSVNITAFEVAPAALPSIMRRGQAVSMAEQKKKALVVDKFVASTDIHARLGGAASFAAVSTRLAEFLSPKAKWSRLSEKLLADVADFGGYVSSDDDDDDDNEDGGEVIGDDDEDESGSDYGFGELDGDSDGDEEGGMGEEEEEELLGFGPDFEGLKTWLADDEYSAEELQAFASLEHRAFKLKIERQPEKIRSIVQQAADGLVLGPQLAQGYRMLSMQEKWVQAARRSIVLAQTDGGQVDNVAPPAAGTVHEAGAGIRRFVGQSQRRLRNRATKGPGRTPLATMVRSEGQYIEVGGSDEEGEYIALDNFSFGPAISEDAAIYLRLDFCRGTGRKIEGWKTTKQGKQIVKANTYAADFIAVEDAEPVFSNELEPWFHCLMTRQQATKHLRRLEPGTFLVRVAESWFGWSLSWVADRGLVAHTRIDIRIQPRIDKPADPILDQFEVDRSSSVPRWRFSPGAASPQTTKCTGE